MANTPTETVETVEAVIELIGELERVLGELRSVVQRQMKERQSGDRPDVR